MLKELFNALPVTPNQIKIFLITFIAISVMVGLQHMGVHSPFSFLSLDK